MGNAAKSTRVARCRDTEKSKIKSSELTFMKKITPKTIAMFDTHQKFTSPATAGFLIPLLLVCFAFSQQAQAQTNTSFGNGALVSLTTGIWNSAFGFEALNHDTAGNQNTATGVRALFSDINGGYNTAYGVYALYSNTSGFYNSAAGAYSLANNTGDSNTANGYSALYSSTTGDRNTANGYAALYHTTTGHHNTAIGAGALFANTTGSFNVAIGDGVAFGNTSGSNNIILGEIAGGLVTTASNVICIGNGGANVSNSCLIGNIYSNVQPIVGTDPDYVTVNSSGRLGRGNVSSRRYKHDIKPMDKASEAIFALNPVSFRYNKEYDATQTIAFGLIAEEVAKVYPDLVGRNSEGQPESVRYEQINAMLLNEFLKEHHTIQEQNRKIQEQETTITDLKSTVLQQQKGLQAVTLRLEKQESLIQKVSAQIELNKTAPRTVVNNH
jgi:hypothetical protein